MTISINTNLGAMIIQQSLNSATKGSNTAAERLTTGLKVNRAADNAAIMSISKGLDTHIRGSQIAQDSIQTGMNILQTAESDLNVIQGHVSRIRDLATQAASDFYTTDARNAMAAEAQVIYDEIDRIAAGSNFNGINLLDGSRQSMRLQVYAGAGSVINSISVTDAFSNASSSAIGLSTPISTAFASAGASAAYLSECDTALNNISNRLASIGASQNRLESAYDSLSVRSQNLTAAKSTMIDADIAKKTSLYTKNLILQQSSASLLVQANMAPSMALSLI